MKRNIFFIVIILLNLGLVFSDFTVNSDSSSTVEVANVENNQINMSTGVSLSNFYCSDMEINKICEGENLDSDSFFEGPNTISSELECENWCDNLSDDYSCCSFIDAEENGNSVKLCGAYKGFHTELVEDFSSLSSENLIHGICSKNINEHISCLNINDKSICDSYDYCFSESGFKLKFGFIPWYGFIGCVDSIQTVSEDEVTDNVEYSVLDNGFTDYNIIGNPNSNIIFTSNGVPKFNTVIDGVSNSEEDIFVGEGVYEIYLDSVYYTSLQVGTGDSVEISPSIFLDSLIQIYVVTNGFSGDKLDHDVLVFSQTYSSSTVFDDISTTSDGGTTITGDDTTTNFDGTSNDNSVHSQENSIYNGEFYFDDYSLDYGQNAVVHWDFSNFPDNEVYVFLYCPDSGYANSRIIGTDSDNTNPQGMYEFNLDYLFDDNDEITCKLVVYYTHFIHKSFNKTLTLNSGVSETSFSDDKVNGVPVDGANSKSAANVVHFNDNNIIFIEGSVNDNDGIDSYDYYAFDVPSTNLHKIVINSGVSDIPVVLEVHVDSQKIGDIRLIDDTRLEIETYPEYTRYYVGVNPFNNFNGNYNFTISLENDNFVGSGYKKGDYYFEDYSLDYGQEAVVHWNFPNSNTDIGVELYCPQYGSGNEIFDYSIEGNNFYESGSESFNLNNLFEENSAIEVVCRLTVDYGNGEHSDYRKTLILNSKTSNSAISDDDMSNDISSGSCSNDFEVMDDTLGITYKFNADGDTDIGGSEVFYAYFTYPITQTNHRVKGGSCICTDNSENDGWVCDWLEPFKCDIRYYFIDDIDDGKILKIVSSSLESISSRYVCSGTALNQEIAGDFDGIDVKYGVFEIPIDTFNSGDLICEVFIENEAGEQTSCSSRVNIDVPSSTSDSVIESPSNDLIFPPTCSNLRWDKSEVFNNVGKRAIVSWDSTGVVTEGNVECNYNSYRNFNLRDSDLSSESITFNDFQLSNLYENFDLVCSLELSNDGGSVDCGDVTIEVKPTVCAIPEDKLDDARYIDSGDDAEFAPLDTNYYYTATCMFDEDRGISDWANIRTYICPNDVSRYPGDCNEVVD